MIFVGSMKLYGALVLLAPMVAAAEPLSLSGQAPDYGFVGEPNGGGLVLARQVLPASRPINASSITGTAPTALALSKIIYLNKNGVTLSPGDNDSRLNRSSIVTATTAIPAWNVSSTTWSETVTCMRELFQRFDVQIVDTDPGNVPHMEAVFGGSPTQLGLPTNVAGVSPFTTDCAIIENSIVFTFSGAFTFTSREACEIMAQEVAHSYGLDHELLASDPMTYLTYTGNRAFQDQLASCGESTARVCGINGSTCRQQQNSVALLRERLGIADAIAPTLAWTQPANNSTVPPGFEVKASGTDNIAVMGAVLKIDGQQVEMVAGAGPFNFITPATLTEGAHTVIVEVSDGKNIQSETRSVTVAKGAPPGGTTGSGDDDALNNGDIVGGCSTGKSGSLLLALLFVAMLVTRRRR